MPAVADTPEEAPASQEPVDLQAPEAPEDSTAAERQRLDPVVESDLSAHDRPGGGGSPPPHHSLTDEAAEVGHADSFFFLR
ncbi:UNVERIFIED_CONTAM: hypothetical protein K2H54_070088, partial [Gekko kuhli]